MGIVDGHVAVLVGADYQRRQVPSMNCVDCWNRDHKDTIALFVWEGWSVCELHMIERRERRDDAT